jgi:Asp-tRNA(Asn)/Glu-tRNA(Gln) amidotransferase A subunit family amidase
MVHRSPTFLLKYMQRIETETTHVTSLCRRISTAQQRLTRMAQGLALFLRYQKRALEEGDALDKHLKSTSDFIGPLHSIPVPLKDQAETKGLATTYGSIVARNSDNVLTEDSTVVRKLKGAGAVVLGKTTMPGKSSWKS